MIDTIAITIHSSQFTITNPARFNPSAETLLNPGYRFGGRGNGNCKQNPSPSELKAGIYKPRLTLTKRMHKSGGYQVTLRVELSLPKLIYLNNFEELVEDDYPKLLSKLQQTLAGMGVQIAEEELSCAPVSAIHYGKNIILPKYTIPSQYLAELNKVDMSRVLDINQTDFRNGGQSWKTHTNSYEVVFYDKISDLQKGRISDKRTMEVENEIQIGLLEELSSRPVKDWPQVLRMEVRLGNRRIIRSLLKSLKLTVEPTFANLFSLKIATKILLYYLCIIDKQHKSIPKLHNTSSSEFLAMIKAQHPAISINQALQQFGYYMAMQELSVVQMKKISDRFGAHAWRSIQKQEKAWGYAQQGNISFSPIRQAIEEFIPVQKVDILPELINNDKRASKQSYAEYLLQH